MRDQENREKWQAELVNLITDPAVLLQRLSLDSALLPAARQSAELFPLRVTESYLSRIKPGNADDPLLRQVLPLGDEQVDMHGYITDPLQEGEVNPVKGLLHKYHGRVLVTLTSSCAIHCRYCFRRHFPYADNNPGKAGWQHIFAYLQSHPEINEVILSGGDPLSVNDNTLKAFSDSLQSIKHIERLRIHTRMPVVLPKRITDQLIDWLASLSMQKIIVLHVNHANEIDDLVAMKLQKLKQTGVTLLNQSVLLRGVNDDVKSLVDLSNALFASGVLPYYMHILDKVKSAHHFDMPMDTARDLHKQMQKQLPGYLVPRLALEKGGEASKTLIL